MRAPTLSRDIPGAPKGRQPTPAEVADDTKQRRHRARTRHPLPRSSFSTPVSPISRSGITRATENAQKREHMQSGRRQRASTAVRSCRGARSSFDNFPSSARYSIARIHRTVPRYPGDHDDATLIERLIHVLGPFVFKWGIIRVTERRRERHCRSLLPALLL